MNREHWKELEHRALWLLGHADQVAPREPLHGMALQLRLWRYVASGPHASWSIILPVRDYRERSAVVREAAWDRALDRKRRKVTSLDPTVRIRDAELRWEELSPFLDAAGGLRPSVVAMPAGADTAGMEGTRSFSHVRLEWSGRGPRAWAPTIAWFERFRKLLARTLR